MVQLLWEYFILLLRPIFFSLIELPILQTVIIVPLVDGQIRHDGPLSGFEHEVWVDSSYFLVQFHVGFRLCVFNCGLSVGWIIIDEIFIFDFGKFEFDLFYFFLIAWLNVPIDFFLKSDLIFVNFILFLFVWIQIL